MTSDKEVIEILARGKQPLSWADFDDGRCGYENNFIKKSLVAAEKDIAALTAAGLEIGPGWSDDMEAASEQIDLASATVGCGITFKATRHDGGLAIQALTGKSDPIFWRSQVEGLVQWFRAWLKANPDETCPECEGVGWGIGILYPRGCPRCKASGIIRRPLPAPPHADTTEEEQGT